MVALAGVRQGLAAARAAVRRAMPHAAIKYM
jgi:hypothetical protein